MSNQLVIDRLNLLLPEYKSYLLSGAPGEIATTFSEPHQFSPEQTIVLENGFVMYLLFFMNIEEFTKYINTECGLPESEASLLAAGMHNALPEQVQSLVVNTQFEIDTTESAPATEGSDATSSLAEDLAEIEKSLHQISPVRTMASDGKQIGYSSTTEDTYSSSQSNIIDK